MVSPLVFALFSGSRDLTSHVTKSGGGGWRTAGSRADGAAEIGACIKYNCMSTKKITWALNLTKYAGVCLYCL